MIHFSAHTRSKPGKQTHTHLKIINLTNNSINNMIRVSLIQINANNLSMLESKELTAAEIIIIKINVQNLHKPELHVEFINRSDKPFI